MPASFACILRARSGTRIEETAKLVDQVEAAIRKEIPAAEFAGILDNIGIPNSGICLSYSNSGLIGTGDADILVSLKHGHRPTEEYVRRLRVAAEPANFPGPCFISCPADIVSQTLNFGLPAPFNVQIVGPRPWRRTARSPPGLADRIRRVPGAVDVRVQQPADLPKLKFAIDRTKAGELGLSEKRCGQFGSAQLERQRPGAARLTG